MAYNLPVVEDRYGALGIAAGVVPAGTEIGRAANKFVQYVNRLVARLGLPVRIGEIGVTEGDVESLVEAVAPAGSLKTNPRRVTRKELEELLRKAL
jgi:alcohol dehydrogenase class IV